MYAIEQITPRFQETWQDLFEQAVRDRELTYDTSSLYKTAFEEWHDLYQAVERALTICRISGLPIRGHFKSIFVGDNSSHTIRKDWRLSKLAYLLVLMNGASDNPMVSKLQIALIKNFIRQ